MTRDDVTEVVRTRLPAVSNSPARSPLLAIARDTCGPVDAACRIGGAIARRDCSVRSRLA
jgi:hypothetical protein